MNIGIWIMIVFPPLFLGMWCLICVMLSNMGGWKRLANRYPAPDRPTGERHSMASAMIGGVSYKSCLTLYSSTEGIYFSVWIIFRMNHRPFLIPWSELNNLQVKKLLWSKYVKFDVGTPKIATISLSEKLFGSFQKMAETSREG